MLHNICNMCNWVLPDMSALALGCFVPSGSSVNIRQIHPTHITYITYAQGTVYIYVSSYTAWWFTQAVRLHEAPIVMCIAS